MRMHGVSLSMTETARSDRPCIKNTIDWAQRLFSVKAACQDFGATHSVKLIVYASIEQLNMEAKCLQLILQPVRVKLHRKEVWVP